MSMSQSAASGSVDTSGLFGEWRRREPTLAAFALVMVVAMAPTLIAMAIDARTFNGINVWIKPLLESRWRFSRRRSPGSGAILDASARRESVRVAFSSSAAPLFKSATSPSALAAEASHFNNSTPLAAAAYGLMGIGILVQVSLAAWAGRLILRSSEGGISPTVRLAIGLGLIGGNVLGAITGGYMSSQSGHWVGGVATDAGGVPLFGWSRTGGDLRVAHFIGLHAMQGIPVIGYLVRNLPAGRMLVWTALAMWTAITAALFLQAMQGRSLLPL
jgi:hypothetical protein